MKYFYLKKVVKNITISNVQFKCLVKLLSNCRSDVIWEEQKKKGRWKALKVRLSEELEGAWTKIQRDLSMGSTQSYIYKSADLEVSMPMVSLNTCYLLLSHQHGCNCLQAFQYNMTPV